MGLEGGFELLISEITESVLDYPVPHKTNVTLMLSLPTYHGIYYTKTISNQITRIYWPRTKVLY